MNTNPDVKRVLCFGDSLTWGYKPGTGQERYPINKRWTGILQELLGTEYEILEEGLNSRTLNTNDKRPDKEGRNGSQYIIPCLDSHDPLDLVILMLGTNELKDTFMKTSEEVIRSFSNFVETITSRKSQFRDSSPKLIVLIPPPIDLTKGYAKRRYSKSDAKYINITQGYKEIAENYDVTIVNTADYVKTGSDGVHMTEESNSKLAALLYKKITKQFM